MPSSHKPDAARTKRAHAKPATKPSATKSSAAKPAPAKQPAAKRAAAAAASAKAKPRVTAARLQDELKALETRLKRADTRNRNSTKALRTVVDTLEARLCSDGESRAALQRQLDHLSAQLDGKLAAARSDVRTELKSALSQGGLPRLEEALARAQARVDAAEIAQADALARINRHLADMARAVDARIAQEARDRVRDIKGVEARLDAARQAVDTRIDGVERDSADALTRMGDQVSRIHDKLQDTRQGDADTVTRKVNELALQTQAEFEAHQSRLDARLQAIEHRQVAFDPNAAREDAYRLREEMGTRLLQLQTRIEELERDSALMAMQAQPVQAAPYTTPPMPSAAAAAPAQRPDVPANPYAHAVEPAAPHVDAVSAAEAGAPEPARDSHIPVEFDPGAFQAANANPAPTLVPFPARAHAPAPGPAAHANAATRPAMPEAPAATPVPPLPVEPDFEPAPLPGPAYANPAYAEDTAEQAPRAVRIADDEPARGLSGRLPLGSRAVKLAALGVGVSALALITARSLLGGNPAPNVEPQLQPMLDAPAAASAQDGAVQRAPEVFGFDAPPSQATLDPAMAAPVAPIGQYEEAAPVRIDARELGTLEAAVEAGDPIAQFQMALAKLENGQLDAGAALLKKAADADQPAALYRLAKLHETGQGVARDDAAARRLIERAARSGNRIAMHDLGIYYTEGRGGLDADMRTAMSWFEQAAMRGVIDSQYNLGLISASEGPNRAPDFETAQFWFEIAARQGDQYAQTQRDALAPQLDADAAARVADRVAAFEPRPIDEEANGIFGPQPWSAQASRPGPREDVRTAQSYLGQLGFAVGAADGLMGSKTRSAVSAFQRSNGLEETGRIDQALLERLALAVGA